MNLYRKFFIQSLERKNITYAMFVEQIILALNLTSMKINNIKTKRTPALHWWNVEYDKAKVDQVKAKKIYLRSVKLVTIKIATDHSKKMI